MQSTEPDSVAAHVPAVAVTVLNLAGVVLTSVSPVPASVAELKVVIEEQVGMPRALQKLVKFGDVVVYVDDHKLEADLSCELVLVQDETPLWTWDVENNPSKSEIEVDGSVVRCPNMRKDFVNVVTREPIRKGAHYFEFVMHRIGDEQSCGLVNDPSQAGSSHGIRSLTAWTYYVGRMGSRSGSLKDGKGALHARGKAVKEFMQLKPTGDIIGMLADLDRGAVAFSLNGELQGACPIPSEPLWVLTQVDTPDDIVELRKPCLDDAPPANLEALQGALLDISQGESLQYSLRRF